MSEIPKREKVIKNRPAGIIALKQTLLLLLLLLPLLYYAVAENNGKVLPRKRK